MRFVVVLLLAAGCLSGAPFTNGGFETHTCGSGSVIVLPAGATCLNGWLVTSPIDLIDSYWPSSEGSFSLDLSATDAGGISQTFDTLAGHLFRVTFDLAGNPDGGSLLKWVTVTAPGFSQSYSFNITGHSRNDRASMGWVTLSFDFTSDVSGSSTLVFTSNEASPYGPALDNVTVTDLGGADVPEPAGFILIAPALIAFGMFRRRA